MIRLLHAGCGGDPLPSWLGPVEETRLDIDLSVEPHILASITDMGEIGPFDAIWCCHTLEHLAPWDVPIALKEFRRVLRDGGRAMILVPDLEDVKPTFDVLYQSQSGPVTGHDMYYGYARYVAKSEYMQHRCGFVRETMRDVLTAAGFSHVEAKRIPDYNLLGVGTK